MIAGALLVILLFVIVSVLETVTTLTHSTAIFHAETRVILVSGSPSSSHPVVLKLVPETAPELATLVGVIAPRVRVIAGVVDAVATLPLTQLAVTTLIVVTVPTPLASRAACVAVEIGRLANVPLKVADPCVKGRTSVVPGVPRVSCEIFLFAIYKN